MLIKDRQELHFKVCWIPQPRAVDEGMHPEDHVGSPQEKQEASRHACLWAGGIKSLTENHFSSGGTAAEVGD